jgi:hypothetical protein
LLSTGCAPRITPPPSPSHPVTVFVADYGRHSSLLLPDKRGGLVEFAWGDYAWFAQNHTGSGNAFSALFWSDGSGLGIRRLPIIPGYDELKKTLDAKRLLCFPAPADKAKTLREHLAAQIDLHDGQMIYSSKNKMYFVHDDDHYWLAHNCNHVTAEWLRELGCKVEGPILLSDFKLNPQGPHP